MHHPISQLGGAQLTGLLWPQVERVIHHGKFKMDLKTYENRFQLVPEFEHAFSCQLIPRITMTTRLLLGHHTALAERDRVRKPPWPGIGMRQKSCTTACRWSGCAASNKAQTKYKQPLASLTFSTAFTTSSDCPARSGCSILEPVSGSKLLNTSSTADHLLSSSGNHEAPQPHQSSISLLYYRDLRGAFWNLTKLVQLGASQQNNDRKTEVKTPSTAKPHVVGFK